MSNFKTIIFLVLILAISSKNFKKQEGAQPAPHEPRPDIMEVGFKHFILNARLDLDSFIRGARDFCRDVQIPEPSREGFEAIFQNTDVDGDGHISGEEFKHIIEYVKDQVERAPQSNFAQRTQRIIRNYTWIQNNQSKKPSVVDGFKKIKPLTKEYSLMVKHLAGSVKDQVKRASQSNFAQKNIDGSKRTNQIKPLNLNGSKKPKPTTRENSLNGKTHF